MYSKMPTEFFFQALDGQLYCQTIVTINVLWIFLTVQWAGLKCLIVFFPGHSHLLLFRVFQAHARIQRIQSVVWIPPKELSGSANAALYVTFMLFVLHHVLEFYDIAHIG